MSKNKLLAMLGLQGEVETKSTIKTSDGKEFALSTEALEVDAIALEGEAPVVDGNYETEEGTKFSIKDGVVDSVGEAQELESDYVTKKDFADAIGLIHDTISQEFDTKLSAVTEGYEAKLGKLPRGTKTVIQPIVHKTGSVNSFLSKTANN